MSRYIFKKLSHHTNNIFSPKTFIYHFHTLTKHITAYLSKIDQVLRYLEFWTLTPRDASTDVTVPRAKINAGHTLKSREKPEY